MIEPFLKSQLEPLARRRRWMFVWRGLAICWAVAALAGIGFLLLDQFTGWASPLVRPGLGLLAFAGAIIVWQRRRRWEPDFRQIARQIEQQHPELHALLVTAVEQQPDRATGKLNYLQERVVREAILESQKHQWIDAVPTRQVLAAQVGHLAALIVFVLVLTGLRVAPPVPGGSMRREIRGVTVTPGDTSIERGNALTVLARFSGPLPPEVTLVTRPDLQDTRRLPLVKSLNDPVFGASVPEVNADFTYHLEYAGKKTRDFKVKVFEYPRLERADVELTYPEYTGLTGKRIEDTRRVSAVEGSRLDLSLQLNKPVASAKLVAKDKTVLPLLIETNKAAVSLKQFALTASKAYELQLVDAEGRTNKIPTQFVIDVLKNRAPELKLAFPRGDQRVSPLQELGFQAEVWDDFGLRAYGIAYTLAGQEPRFIELGKSAPANEKRQLNYLLKLEDLSAEPDQLISYYVWADDVGPDGASRRTSSDMYFAEVRPFEEIFREGQAQEGGGGGGGGGQQGNETLKLAELQKQIINATWKLQREEAVKNPSVQYKKDSVVVQQSQEHALDQVETLKERASDARSRFIVETVEKEMEKAVRFLTEATNSPAPLPSALTSEQSAYQALLKLSAREYQVSTSRSRGGGGGGGQRNQQQLDQLELKQSENRYETQRQASPQQNAEKREQLQVLNRLKELAQRQKDLNERLKELQTSLQEARTETEREEVRRRLKRLREEEQQMLADVDELRQRMERPENQQRMAEARKQLDQTRSDVQRASEAIEKEAVSQALTSGTRAERDLQQLRDDFRKKNSSQFAEEMRQMRSDARELAKKEEEIGKKIEGLTDNKRKTLSDSGERKELADQLGDQKKRLTNVLDHASQVTQQAEVAEPLLSKQLYDTLRKNSQEDSKNVKETTAELVRSGALTKSVYDLLQKTDQADAGKPLEVTSALLREGLIPQATQIEQRARAGIEELKRGVERAAESVLGDDTEALRLARKELDDLTDQLNREISQADPNAQRDGQQAASQAGKAAQGDSSGKSAEQQSQAQNGGRPGEQAQNSQEKSGSQPNPSAQSGESPGGRQPGNSERASQSNGGSPSPRANDPSSPQQAQAGTPGQQSGGGGNGAQAQSTPRGGQQQDASPQNGPRERSSLSNRGGGGGGGNDRTQRNRTGLNLGDQGGGTEGGGETGGRGPLTGEEYGQWSDRLRDVEEMLDLPEFRNEVATVRERARALRMEFKRHSKPPQWPLVRAQILAPLTEVRNQIAEELARREANNPLVPIDRDPVPTKFSDLVRRYYEKLGSE